MIRHTREDWRPILTALQMDEDHLGGSEGVTTFSEMARMALGTGEDQDSIDAGEDLIRMVCVATLGAFLQSYLIRDPGDGALELWLELLHSSENEIEARAKLGQLEYLNLQAHDKSYLTTTIEASFIQGVLVGRKLGMEARDEMGL